jgi:hypothetical protein
VTMKKNTSSTLLLLALAILVVTLVTVVKKVKNSDSTAGAPVDAASLALLNTNYNEVQGILVDSFPEFPVYPDGVVVSSRKYAGAADGVSGYSGVWVLSGDNVMWEIAQWYTNKLSEMGWQKTALEDRGDSEQILNMVNGDRILTLDIIRGTPNNSYEITVNADLPNPLP